MDTLNRTLHTTAMRMRKVRLVELLLQHLALACLALLALLLLDKTGLIVLSDWTGSGIFRNGGWAAPTWRLPVEYQVAMPALVAAALLLTLLRLQMERRFTPLRAALALDERLGLEERMISASLMARTPVAMARPLLEDAVDHCRVVKPRETFPLQGGWGGRKLPWLVGGALALLVLAPDMDLLGKREALRKQKVQREKDRHAIEKLANDMKKEAEKLRKAMQNRKAAKDLEEMTKKMENLAEKLKNDPDIDPKKAKEMVRRLEEEVRKDLHAKAEDKLKLASLPKPTNRRSLMKKVSDEMRKNDLQGAAEAMRKMKRKLMKKMDKDELKRLREDMRNFADQLDKHGLKKLSKAFKDMADELASLEKSELFDKQKELQDKLKEALKDALKDENKGGSIDLSQLTEEERQLLRELQQKLAQMDYTADQLEQMAQAAKQGQVRQMTMQELRDMLKRMKQQQNCQTCKGAGSIPCPTCGGDGKLDDGKPCPDCQGTGKQPCPDCQGQGQGQSGGGLGMLPGGGMNLGQNSGSGQGNNTGGAGQGRGGRPPEAESDHDFKDWTVRARSIRQGKIVGQTFVRGLPPKEGEGLKTDFAETLQAVESAPETAREKELIPREDRDMVRAYNNRLRSVDAD